MALPIIFAIDDDQQVLRALSRDIRANYREQYRLLNTASVREALDALKDLKNKGETIALFIADQRMPELDGVSFLEEAMDLFPQAKKVLLTAYSDTEAAIKAINEVKLDYYLMKPWDPPEERLYPVLDDLLDEWQNLYKPDAKGIKVIGYQFSPKSHDIKEFLAGNLVPYHWWDVEKSEEATDLLQLNAITLHDLPAVFFEDGTFLKTPSPRDIAAKIGLTPTLKNEMYDVVIIGAGPAGLAASVYGASEGLKTLLIERHAPGGQAGTSSRIENYLGFPSGLSGSELTRRAVTQATRFGTEFLSQHDVRQIAQKDGYKKILLDDNKEVNTRSIIIATGVEYRKLETKGIEDFTGAGIYYGAAMTEAASCKDKQAYIIGGGNSAGQAAMYLSKFAKNVYILIRKEDLTSTMSAYLIDQIAGMPNIKVLGNTEVREAQGNGRLECLVLENIKTGERQTCPADVLYIFIGSKPGTEWIGSTVLKNSKGFIETGRELKGYEDFKKLWKLNRDPYLLETSSHGIFAAGDVRAGAMNRVASAVGEGSMSISFVHKYLAEV
jgi:thioredoxin reductase (NADPH)